MLFLLFVLVLLAYLGYRHSADRSVLKKLYPEKVWYHRANSLGKLAAEENKYHGLELDVVFMDDHFDIHHPPKKPSNLSLDTFLSKVEDKDKELLWLDYKNLDSLNMSLSLTRLNLVIENNGFDRDQFIVESTEIHFLKAFEAANYTVSYYLPQKLWTLPADSLAIELERINTNLQRHNVDYISTDYKDYDIINDHFPDMEKLLWMFGRKKNGLSFSEYRKQAFKMLNDDNVKVILM